MSLKALIFDVDGTLATTESDGHLRAFNEAFKLLNLGWHWDNATYSELLHISGGKERIAHFIEHFQPSGQDLGGEIDIAKIHQLKTDIFVGYVAQGCVSIRTGVARLVDEAIECGLRLAIATTTSMQNVEAILAGGGLSSKFELIAAGDVVQNKKPAGDIYQFVLDEMGLSANECIVFEDSAVGFASASSVGIKTVVTLSEYTKSTVFEGALVVVDHLGEKGEPFEVISGNPSPHFFVNVEYLMELHEQHC